MPCRACRKGRFQKACGRRFSMISSRFLARTCSLWRMARNRRRTCLCFQKRQGCCHAWHRVRRQDAHSTTSCKRSSHQKKAGAVTRARVIHFPLAQFSMAAHSAAGHAANCVSVTQSQSRSLRARRRSRRRSSRHPHKRWNLQDRGCNDSLYGPRFLRQHHYAFSLRTVHPHFHRRKCEAGRPCQA